MIKAFNESPSSHLLGGSPADASKPEEHRGLAFQLDWNASEDMRHNAAEIEKREGPLEQTGAFRTLVHAPKLGRRVYKNVLSERTHGLWAFDETGAYAKDEDSNPWDKGGGRAPLSFSELLRV